MKLVLKRSPIWLAVFLLMTTSRLIVRADTDAGTPAQLPSVAAASSKPAQLAPENSADNIAFTGSFSQNVPIEVPPGIGGFQPNLSLQYVSNLLSGSFGLGWDLSLGRIERSSKNGIPTYDDNTDVFTFLDNGQTHELVKISEKEFRMKIEGDFLKFVREENYWIVFDKSGTRRYFGQTEAAQTVHPSLGKTYQWALEKVIDPNNNVISITYEKEEGCLFYQSILYGGHFNSEAPGGLDRSHDRRVTFQRISGTNGSVSFRGGFSQTNRYRFNLIETAVLAAGTWTPVRRYELQYATPGAQARSELAKITVTGLKDGQQLTLPLGSFSYQTTPINWITESNPAYALPVSLLYVDPNGFGDYGVRFADLDGNGLVDLVHSHLHANSGSRVNEAWRNTGAGWASLSYALPVDIAVRGSYKLITGIGPGGVPITSNQYYSWDNGVRFVDLDGDGKTDILQSLSFSNGGRTVNAWINNGSGWTSSPAWNSPVDFVIRDAGLTWARDNGVALTDVNGDGRVDLVFASGASRGTWINTGSGWQSDSRWNLPAALKVNSPQGQSSRSNGVDIVDLNGDGLPDVIQRLNTGSVEDHVWLNTGSGWQEEPQLWHSPFDLTTVGRYTIRQLPTGLFLENWEWYDGGIRFADLNGDGLVDMIRSIKLANGNIDNFVYVNSGRGWNESGLKIPQYFTVVSVDSLGYSHGVERGFVLCDLNGDGQSDIVRKAEAHVGSINLVVSYVGLSAAKPELIETVTSATGGQTHLSYNNISLTGGHNVPFSLTVLTSLSRAAGQGPDAVTTYKYEGGYFDTASREFLGFGKVEAADAEANRTITYYHQDKDGENRTGNAVPQNALKGRPLRVEKYDASLHLLTSQETRWEYILPFSGVYFVRPRWVRSTLHDASPALTTEIEYVYDDLPDGFGFGNVIKKLYKGDTAVSSDETTEIIDYALNGPSWILKYPSRIRIQGPTGSPLSDTYFFYDGFSSVGTITKGNRTLEQRFVNKPNFHWLSTKTEYNILGQVVAETDPLNNKTTKSYDEFGLLKSVINPLEHELKSLYDVATGNVLSETDANGSVTTYRYDPLGRLTAVINPLDSADFPTVTYDYHDSLIGQPGVQHIETLTRLRHGESDTLWSKSTFDGLGRVTRLESEAEPGDASITDTTYNNRDMAELVSVPRFQSSTSEVKWTRTFYDGLGRVIQVTHPDNTSTFTTYQGRRTSVIDAKGNKESTDKDAYDRIVARIDARDRKTVYEYDVLGNLLRITDPREKITTFTYDTVKRKLAMTDPNLGGWNWDYDDNGNILQQTDARKVGIATTYDALNRPVKRTISSDPNRVTGRTLGFVLASFSYDDPDVPYSKGRLTTVTDPSGSYRPRYDALGQVSAEIRGVDGLFYTSSMTFDARGNLDKIIHPSGHEARNIYNEGGRLSSITDEEGKVYATLSSYDAAGRPGLVTRGAQTLQTNLTYDPLKNVLSSLKTTVAGQEAPLQDLSYSFNEINNLTALTDKRRPEQSQSFTYDPLNQLTEAKSEGSYATQQFDYDEVGNFLTKGDSSYKYEYSTHPYAVSQTVPTDSPVRDPTAILAWDLDPSEPIYRIKGRLNLTSHGVANWPVSLSLSGKFDQTIKTGSPFYRAHHGEFEFRGLASGEYSLRVSSGQSVNETVFSPLSNNEDNLQFELITDTNPALIPPLTSVLNQSVVGPAFTNGVFHKALSFDGQNDIFVIPNETSVSSSAATFMIWAKPTPSPAPLTDTTLMAKSLSAYPGRSTSGFRLTLSPAGKVTAELGRSFSGAVMVSSVRSLAPDEWTFICVTYDGSNLRLFLNSQLESSKSDSGGIRASGMPVTLGASLNKNNRVAVGTAFSGALDEPRIFNRVWSLEDIQKAHKSFLTSVSYSYDANGNCVSKTAFGEQWIYRYDAENHLILVKRNGLLAAGFVYDAQGARVRKITPAGTTRYIGRTFEVRPGGSFVEHVFAGSNLIADVVRSNTGTQVYYTLPDHLGSISVVADPSGTVVQETTYLPFGAASTKTGNSPVRRGYTTQEEDAETNLYYYNARYYDPTLGRFMTGDPAIREAQSAFLHEPKNTWAYVYASNNPLRYTDPTGLYSWEESLQENGNFGSGFFDRWTSLFGLFPISLTEMARIQIGANGQVNPESVMYGYGRMSANVVALALAAEYSPSLFFGRAAAIGTGALGAGGTAGLTANEVQIVLKEGQYINRVWDSRWTPGSLYSGPFGGSYSPNGALPLNAADAIKARGLNILGDLNNSERGGIYVVTRDIPTILRTSIRGTEPELFIAPQYHHYLNLLYQYISTLPNGR